MAEILKARDTTQPSASVIAVKRILPHLTDDRQYVTMFLDESRVLAQLEHENIIHTLEVGQVEETPFIALEYVWGQDARMLFHRARRLDQKLPIGIACYIIARACAGLHHAHEHADAYGNLLGLVHRDVSLQNILLSYEGAVKLTDFGIAMSSENVARTEAGIVKGKFGYMSPEQIRGEAMDRRSDVFAAGICLYELLTNERLFSGESDYAAVAKVRNAVIEPPSRLNREIPSALEGLAMRALAKQPRDRFQTAGDMCRALLAFMAESQNECSDKDLARFMRELFADELVKQPTPEALRPHKPRTDEPTGLAAFDNLEPVSTLSAASALVPSSAREYHDTEQLDPVREAPSVPPIVPRRDSVPAGRSESDMFRRSERPSAVRVADGHAAGAGPALDLDWDEDDPPTGSERSPSVPPLPDPLDDEELASEDDVTRQMYVGETFSGIDIGISGVRRSGAVPEAALVAELADRAREPTTPIETPRESIAPRPIPQTSYWMVIGIVAGIVAVIVGLLYLTRGAQDAKVHLATAPVDAIVSVDGVPVPGQSPFMLDKLKPRRSHRLEVEHAGYHSWSTRLVLSPGQVLNLPLVALEADSANLGAAQATSAATSANDAKTTKPSSVQPSPEAPPNGAPTKANPSFEPHSGKTFESGARSRPGPRAGKSRAVETMRKPVIAAAPSAPPSASGAGKGILRINSRPWAELTIDGKRAGTTPQMNLALAAGTHSVRLSNPQFGLNKTIKVQIAAGETVTKVVELQ